MGGSSTDLRLHIVWLCFLANIEEAGNRPGARSSKPHVGPAEVSARSRLTHFRWSKTPVDRYGQGVPCRVAALKAPDCGNTATEIGEHRGGVHVALVRRAKLRQRGNREELTAVAVVDDHPRAHHEVVDENAGGESVSSRHRANIERWIIAESSAGHGQAREINRAGDLVTENIGPHFFADEPVVDAVKQRKAQMAE